MKIFKNKILRWFFIIIGSIILYVSINLLEKHIGYKGMSTAIVASFLLVNLIDNYLINKLSEVKSAIISLIIGLVIFGIASLVIISIQP